MFYGGKTNLKKGNKNAKKDISEKQVFELAKLHCTYEEIANILDISKGTLTNRFKQVIQKGYEDVKRSLRKKQLELARSGNVTMLIWLGKQYLGQTDKINQSGLSEEETNRLRNFLNEQMTNSI